MRTRITRKRWRLGAPGFAVLAVALAGCATTGTATGTAGPASPGPLSSAISASSAIGATSDEPGAAIDDCPLTLAGWAGSGGSSGITVTVRAAGPLDATLDVVTDAADPVRAGGLIPAGAPGASFPVPVDRTQVIRVVLRTSGGSAPPVVCQVTGGD